MVEHVRLKYGCRSCEIGVKAAPVPASPIPKSIATPGLLAWITISKYGDALPLYRQVAILKRMNVDISRATLANWMIRSAELLKPLYEALKQRLLKQPAIMADETTVQVLNEPGRDATKKSYMWLYRNAPYSSLDADQASWLCRQNSNLFFKLPAELQNARRVVLAALDGDGQFLEKPEFEKYQEDKEAVLRAVCHDGRALRFASSELQGDKDVVLAAISQKGWALEYASDALREDAQVVWTAVNESGLSIKSAGKAFHKDVAIMSAEIKENPYAIIYASTGIPEESYFVLAMEAMQSYGGAFDSIDSDRLTYEHYLALAKVAIKAEPWMFQFLKGKAKYDPALAVLAVQHNKDAIRLVPEEIKDDVLSELRCLSN